MRRWIVVNALCCAAVLVACGGDDDPAPERAATRATSGETRTTSAEIPTTGAWAKRVNATCREGNAEVTRIVGRIRKEQPSALAFTAESIERSVPALRRGLRRQRAIEAPVSLRSEYQRFISDLEDGVTLYEQFGRAIRSRSEARVQALQPQFRRLAARTRPFAIEHGLTDCLSKMG